MSYIIKKIGETYNTPTYFFECDNTSDIKEISTNMVPMGSRCRVINEAQEYVLDSAGQWRPILKGDPGASSWNDLQDKPFGEEQAFEPIIFPNNITELENSTYYDLTPFVGQYLGVNTLYVWRIQTTTPERNIFDGSTASIENREYADERTEFFKIDTTVVGINWCDFYEIKHTSGHLINEITPEWHLYLLAVYDENNFGLPCGVYMSGFINTNSGDWIGLSNILLAAYGKIKISKPITITIDEKYLPEHSHKWNNIVDKPFGEEMAIVDILSKEGVSYNEDEGMYTGTLVGIPEVGENYTVTYNGTNYDVSAIDFGGGIIAFGNLGAIGAGENTDEPFAVIINPAVRLVAFTTFDGAQEVSLAIKGYANIIKQLDGKFYISPYVCYIDSLSDSETKYLYSDHICTQKMSYSDFLNSKARPVVLLFGSVQYQPIEVDYEDDYGVATVISLGMNDTIESCKVRRYYTAEYSG